MARLRKAGVNNTPDWIPELIQLDDYGGNWHAYIDAVYDVFRRDFVSSKPIFQGQRLRLKRYPVHQEREATFWHMTSEGEREEERLPDLRRCERIGWAKAVIEHSGDPSVKVWENQRRGEARVCLWLERAEYLVVLAKRRDYALMWTAFMVTQPHQKRKHKRDYERYIQTGAAP